MKRAGLRRGKWLVVLLAACSGASRASRGEGPQRVLSLVPSATEIIVALGRADRLVGRTRFDWDPRLQQLPSVGGTTDASREEVVRLRPDLLIGWSSEGEESRDRYARLGLEIRLVGTETIPQFRHAVDSLGRWLGAQAQADSLLKAVDDSFALVREAGERRRPLSIFYAVWVDPPMTVGHDTFVAELIRLVGGRNVFDDATVDWPTVSLETIVHRDPDVLIWTRSREVPTWSQSLRAHPEWQKVRAVRVGRVLELDGDLFNRPGPRLGYAARVLSEALDSIARLPVLR